MSDDVTRTVGNTVMPVSDEIRKCGNTAHFFFFHCLFVADEEIWQHCFIVIRLLRGLFGNCDFGIDV